MSIPPALRVPLMLIVGYALTAGAGCAGLPAFSTLAAKKKAVPKASAEHPVIECICLWEAGEGTGLDGLPCRGFAGQILFFARGYSEPVHVDGDVTVYLFDDQGTPEEQGQPLHQYQFEGAAFQAFRTDTNLGAAYQLFVPYPRKGNHRAACSLRAKVVTPYGSPIFSRMATVLLPGIRGREEPKSLSQSRGGERKSGIQHASHEIEVALESRGNGAVQAVIPASAADSPATTSALKARLSRAAASENEYDFDAADGKVMIQHRKASAAELFHGQLPAPPPKSVDPPATKSAESRHPLMEGDARPAESIPAAGPSARSRHPLLEE